MDWGVGCYEARAADLLPAASQVIRLAGLQSGERVLDLGCGTGNAALLAAGSGAQVTGVDPASRLLEVARARAASEHADITFVPGEAESIPAETASVDVILSVFAVIYAANPGGAAAEMACVLAPEGRLVLSAWIPAGTMVEMGGVAAESVRQAIGAPPPPDPFPWHDHAALTRLLAPYGFRVHVERHSLAFTAPSAREFLDSTARTLPPAVAVLGILERVGLAEKVRARFLEILEAANESHDAFQITSDYIVAAARR